MFASKLLNVLEALPTDDEEHGDRVVLDAPEEKSTMKENQEANSFAFPTKDLPDSNVNVDWKEMLGCDEKDMDEILKFLELDESVISDDVSRGNDSEVRASIVEDDLNEALPNKFTPTNTPQLEKLNTPELELSIIPDLIDEKVSEAVVPDAGFTSGYKLFETDKKGTVEEYELPEMVVFYKENSWNDAQPGKYVSIPGEEGQHSKTTESADTELPAAGGSKSSVVSENKSENNEEEDTKLPITNDLKPGSPDEVYNDDGSQDSLLEDLVMIFGPKGTAKWKHSDKQPEIGSSANVTPRSDEPKQTDQVPVEGPATDLFNHTKLGTEATVYKVNPTKTASTSNLDQAVEKFPEQLQGVANVGKSLGDYLFEGKGYLADEESIFSGLGGRAGSIIYSRRVLSFGRTSVGSDSSTNSNGSFAFPIVQSERYSSPVRMAQEVQEEEEVETSHPRKQGSWMQNIIMCCKF